MDTANYLPQILEGQTEGPAKKDRAVWYEPFTVTLAAGAETTVTALDIGNHWRVSALDASPAPGSDALLYIWAGETAGGIVSSLALGSGGSVRFPATTRTLTLRNSGTANLIVTAVMIRDYLDDYYPGRSI